MGKCVSRAYMELHDILKKLLIVTNVAKMNIEYAEIIDAGVRRGYEVNTETHAYASTMHELLTDLDRQARAEDHLTGAGFTKRVNDLEGVLRQNLRHTIHAIDSEGTWSSDMASAAVKAIQRRVAQEIRAFILAVHNEPRAVTLATLIKHADDGVWALLQSVRGRGASYRQACERLQERFDEVGAAAQRRGIVSIGPAVTQLTSLTYKLADTDVEHSEIAGKLLQKMHQLLAGVAKTAKDAPFSGV